MAYYLSLLDYTTLGCEYDLPVKWRLLEGMIAISGLMTFAWSTGVLFALAQEFQERELQRGNEPLRLEDDRDRPRHRRARRAVRAS
jgi:hypothetical protein